MDVPFSPDDLRRLVRAVPRVEGLRREERRPQAILPPTRARYHAWVRVTGAAVAGRYPAKVVSGTFDATTNAFGDGLGECWLVEGNGGALDYPRNYPGSAEAVATDGKLIFVTDYCCATGHTIACCPGVTVPDTLCCTITYTPGYPGTSGSCTLLADLLVTLTYGSSYNNGAGGWYGRSEVLDSFIGYLNLFLYCDATDPDNPVWRLRICCQNGFEDPQIDPVTNTGCSHTLGDLGFGGRNDCDPFHLTFNSNSANIGCDCLHNGGSAGGGDGSLFVFDITECGGSDSGSGSGSGSGEGGAMVPCCSDVAMPTVLVASLSNVSGFDCLGDIMVPLVWDGTDWVSPDSYKTTPQGSCVYGIKVILACDNTSTAAGLEIKVEIYQEGVLCTASVESMGDGVESAYHPTGTPTCVPLDLDFGEVLMDSIGVGCSPAVSGSLNVSVSE